MSTKLDAFFNEFKNKDNQISLSKAELEMVIYSYDEFEERFQKRIENERREGRFGMYMVLGTIFFLGLLLGWKWAVHSICDDAPYSSATCTRETLGGLGTT